MEQQRKTYRKPYERAVKRSWWTARREYVAYMIRELTAVTNLWIAAELTWIAWICAVSGSEAAARISALLGNPFTVAANVVAFLGVVYHTMTWYKIFPLGVRVFRSRASDETRIVPRSIWMASLYAVTVAASIIILYGLTYGG